MTKFLNIILGLLLFWVIGLRAMPHNWAIPSICLHPPPRSEGVCMLEIEGYYFDPQKNNCEKYSIGGCRLSGGQSFGSQENCVETCIRGTRHLQDIRHD
ncbi:kunitz-type serine protease inhibitor vestiginin-1 [Stomoxys calcitrans]|uniref:BPTI/Kunitz inhibitor domain-containing protein n=1 Tax=Stomoxys calcitrans TaxID=35570 RepID=A0A1I8P8A6_STOCA|nr:kunitz-type serine protease inhibitor vestiginin-1 [Stomoxys calcitrans]